MDQLEALDRCRPQPRDLLALPEKWSRVTTPLKSEEWERELKDLPDQRCAEFVIRGISEGFRLGFGYASQLQECPGEHVISYNQPTSDRGVLGKRGGSRKSGGPSREL